MTWSAVCLSVVIAAGSPPPQRLNVEPIGFGIAGLVVAGVGAWRLAVAEDLFAQLGRVSPDASNPQEAARLLETARALVVAGKLETAGGGALLFIGGALAVVSAIWFFVEGPTTRDWLVSVGPRGVSVAAQF